MTLTHTHTQSTNTPEVKREVRIKHFKKFIIYALISFIGRFIGALFRIERAIGVSLVFFVLSIIFVIIISFFLAAYHLVKLIITFF